MKFKHQIRKHVAAASLAFALACSTGLAASDIIPPPGAMQPGGDSSDTTLNFGQWWSDTGTPTESFDTSKHSAPSIAGSVHVVFDAAGTNQSNNPLKSANCAFGNWFNAEGDQGWLGAGGLLFDVAGYQSLTFDMYSDPTLNSNLTTISMYLWGGGYDKLYLGDVTLTAGWQHVVLPIPPASVMTDCVGYGPYEWYNTDASTPPCHAEYWFDNVKLVARPVALPPPVMTVAPVSGSRLYLGSGVADGAGARQGIYTMSQVPWISQASPGNPVTYSMTISSVPNPALYSNYQAQIFLVAGAPNGTAAADWNFSDMGFLQIADNADGTATARFMWKTNESGGNYMLWNTQFGGSAGTNGYAAGTLAIMSATGMIGNWSVTFTSDTDVTVTGPGLSTNLSIPADWVASFTSAGSGAMYANFGVQPNSAGNAGQAACLSRASVTGGSAAYAISDNFTVPPLNTTLWGKAASDGPAIGVLPADAQFWVQWNLPANYFDLITTPSIANPRSWVSLTTPSLLLPTPITIFTWDNTNRVPVPASDLANPNQAFFAMIKRTASQLQVLLPGETNAPNTASGKIGTPDPQSVGNAFVLTVNACDSTWHIAATCNDTVAITSSDSTAFLPSNPTLVSGTAVISPADFFFGQAGTWTVTATDVTTNAVAAGTSTAITVQ
ncbi:MAG TPA: hypothetical protein VMU04_12675 [Candidatus Acidoferrum sp.]|nr:hypothetical protein [Candidatus Acidoferrum sp.]